MNPPENINYRESISNKKIEIFIQSPDNNLKLTQKELGLLATSFEVNKGISGLKEDLLKLRPETAKENEDTSNLEKLFLVLQELKSNKEARNSLLQELEQSKIEVNKDKNFDDIISAKIGPKGWLERAQNPKNTTDNIIGAVIGASESILTIAKFTGEVAWGAIKTPYDLYKIKNGSKYENINKI